MIEYHIILFSAENLQAFKVDFTIGESLLGHIPSLFAALVIDTQWTKPLWFLSIRSY